MKAKVTPDGPGELEAELSICEQWNIRGHQIQPILSSCDSCQALLLSFYILSHAHLQQQNSKESMQLASVNLNLKPQI